MPRPGTVEPRAGADAPHGSTAALQRMAQAIPITAEQAAAPPGRPADAAPDPEMDPNVELNGGFDRALFAPTARPDEPITQGAPFGEGANWVPSRNEDDFTFLLRVADDLDASPLANTLSTYTAKIRRGV